MTKPVGVWGVAKRNPIILQALVPPQNTHSLGEQSSYLGLTPHFPIWLPQPLINGPLLL